MSRSVDSMIRFRCTACGQLLGSSPSKLGRWVTCPACEQQTQVKAIDPDTEEEPGSTAEAKLLDQSDPVEMTAPSSVQNFEEVDPADRSASPETNSLNPYGDRPAIRLDSSDQSTSSLTSQGRPRPRTRSSSIIEISPRRRDLLIPRTAVIGWSLIGLLAIGLALICGLLIGRFLWAPISF